MATSPLPKIFIGTALVVSLAAGCLSATAWHNLGKAREDANKEAQARIVPINAQLEKARNEARETKDQLAKAAPAKEAAEAQATAAKTVADQAVADLKTATDQLAKAKDDLTKAQAAQTPAPAPVAQVDPEKEKQLKDALAAVEEKKQIEATLTAKNNDLTAQVKTLEDSSALREKQMSKPGLEGKVLAVNPSWNFVVLSIGDKQGVAPNSMLLIKRGASMVAKVRVTSVEPATSIADIVPGTAAKHFQVQPGDLVIYSGS